LSIGATVSDVMETRSSEPRGNGDRGRTSAWSFPDRFRVRRVATSATAGIESLQGHPDLDTLEPGDRRLVRASPADHWHMIVGRDLVDLFDALEDDGVVVSDEAWALTPRVVALTLDGVLEVDLGHGYVGGPGAAATLGWSGSATMEADPVVELSNAAVQFGASIAVAHPVGVAQSLYRYNALPLTPRWQRRFPTDSHVHAFLRLSEIPLPHTLDRNAWLTWFASDSRDDRPFCKLYVSPTTEALPEVLRKVLELFQVGGARAMKVAGSPSGLLRPDKLVVYFDAWEELRRFADRVGAAIPGTPAHGVPFSAALDGEGLLSWGRDPLPHLWLGGRSWRRWITNAVATALTKAVAGGLGADAAEEFARARLSLEGVDPSSWGPVSGGEDDAG
jgi:hypothetical protein